MKALSILILTLFLNAGLRSQTLDSIYFNLYTDSLKKGTFNYINVEGKYSNGRYLPMSNKELKFSSSAGSFEGNSLYVDPSFKDEKIVVRAFVPGNTRLRAEITIYIKKNPETEKLPTVDEVLRRRDIDTSTTSRKKRSGRR